MTKELFASLAYTFLCIVAPLVADAQPIEYRGDRYVIHVDELELDGDESLMDVLMMCPEVITLDGRDALSDYDIRIDNINIGIDRESFLYHTKAREVGTIQIAMNGVVAKGTDGVKGVIDVRYRNSAAESKVAVQGSTYGSGRIYTDMVRHDYKNHLTLSATAIGNARYSKTYVYGPKQTTRSAIENLRLSAKWQLSERDSLQFNIIQGFDDTKTRIYDPDPIATPTIDRNIRFTTSYYHVFNDKGADMFTEGGYTHQNSNYYGYSATQDKVNSVYVLLESDLPVFCKDLWALVGTENGYDNVHQIGNRRNQFMYNDIYLQLDYKKGPWHITVGDRFRMMNYWQRPYNAPSADLWHYSRNHHGYLGSVAYKFNSKHTVQGSFAHHYYIPDIEEFYIPDKNTGRYNYNTDFRTRLAYVTEVKYTYQNKGLVIMGQFNNANFVDIQPSSYSLQSVRGSAMWHKGIVRLTLGAAFFHRHDRGDNGADRTNTNYWQLKLIPSVNITQQTRFTATLLYNTQRYIYNSVPYLYPDFTPNLYASARLSHSFTKHLNVYGDFQNIAGQKTGNRALIIGATYNL